MAENPYAAPKSHVEDAPTTLPDGDFVPEGRSVPAGNGWRWIADAWTFTGPQRWTFLGVTLVFVILWIVVSLIPLVGPLVCSLMLPVFSGGFMLGCDAVRRGEGLEVGHLFAGFQRHSGKLLALGAISLGVGVVFGLIFIAVLGLSFGAMLIGGAQPSPEEIMALLPTFLLTILIILALSIPWAMAMWFAGPLIVLGESDVGAALKTSFSACLKNLLPFLVWGVAVLFLGLLASIPLLLGWLLLGPVLWASYYLTYRDVFHDT